MKKLLVSTLFAMTVAASFGQGTVNFSNVSSDLSSPPDRLVRYDNTAFTLNAAYTAGTAVFSNGAPGLQATLYYGSSTAAEDSLVAVTNNSPATFKGSTSPNVGTWFGGTRTLQGFVAGDTMHLQVRVWDTNFASSYEAAVALGGAYTGLIGKSAIFLYSIPVNPLSPDAFNMFNFQGFTIGVPQPPTITIQPASQTVAMGSNVAFSVTATGTVPLSYQWWFNGTNIFGASDSAYTRSNAQTTNAGSYSVVVSNWVGSVTSSYATLTVFVPPTITTQPASQTVLAGSNATFSVVATGSPTLTYQWRKNGVNISGAITDFFTLNPVLAGDAGSYDVVVANSFASTTSSAAGLNVTCPAITVSPSSLPGATVGDAYSHTIIASGGTPSYIFSVTSGSLPGGLSLSSGGVLSGTLAGGGVFNFAVTATDANGCTGSRSYSVGISISLTNTINAGYNLIANQLDRGGNTLNEIMPVVPDGCYVFKYDNSMGSYLAGASYSIATASWLHGNTPLRPGEGAFLYSPTNFDLVFTGVPQTPVLPLSACTGYRLLSRQTNEVGTFTNIIGTAPVGGEAVYKWNGSNYDTFTFTSGTGWSPSSPTSAVGEAVWIYTPTGPNCAGSTNNLISPPIITTQPQNQTVAVGANVTFTVVATGGGTLTYQWRLNGVNISGATTSSLNFPNVQPSNSGDYTVVVANDGGATESKIAKLLLTILDGGFADNFANRVTTNSSAGSVSGNSVGATKEIGEPNHAGNTGGKSVWYAWRAPNNGIATFDTKGSSFDTALAVYTGTSLSQLKLIASDDDSGGFYASQVTFNATSNVVYNIAIDGAYGFSGNIVLSWSFEATADVVPEITTQPQNKVAASGADLTLTVVATVSSGSLAYQWYFNDDLILNATNVSYTITNLDATKIGTYKVGVSSATHEVFSTPALVQMATVDVGGASPGLVYAKFEDALNGSGSGGLVAVRKGRPLIGATVSGFTGTQTFNNNSLIYTKQPGEPNHCGVPGGASGWYAYTAPASGHLYVTITEATFDTVVAVYTGNSLLELAPVACANNAVGTGNEAVDFQATAGTVYSIAIDGVNAARGSAKLSYNLVTAPPVIAVAPQSRAVPAGSNVTLTVTMAASTTTLGYQWQFFSTNVPGQTSSSFPRSNFQIAHQGNYRVIVTNMAGAVTGTAMLYLNAPAVRAADPFIDSTVYFQAQLFGPTNSLLVVQSSTNLTNWISVRTNNMVTGSTNFTDGPIIDARRYYRTFLMFP